jgi:hypothetical protein
MKAAQCSPEIYGIARNILVVHASDALAADAGEAGTIAEIAIALKVESPIVGIKTSELGGRLPAAARGSEAVGMRMGMWR